MKKIIALIKTVLFANKAAAAVTLVASCTVVTVGATATGAYIQNKKATESETIVAEVEAEADPSTSIETNGEVVESNTKEVLSESASSIEEAKEKVDTKEEKKQQENRNNVETDTNHRNQNENTNNNSNTNSNNSSTEGGTNNHSGTGSDDSHSGTGGNSNGNTGGNSNGNSNTDANNSSSDKKPEPTPAPQKQKIWVEPVYETIHHPEEVRQKRIVVAVTCKCGEQFPDAGAWQAHRPVPCDGNHNYYDPIIEYETVVKPAWTEVREVSPGYWKEI